MPASMTWQHLRPGYGSGDVENTTPANSPRTQPLSRSDFYELIPGTQAISKLVGYFDSSRVEA